MEKVKKGKISVHTENIFPIIKKSLYSDHDIFLRELISNAVDATSKMKALASMGEFKGELGDLKIHVSVDKNKKEIRIADRGIGMTADEIEKYINQIAFSGATEFVEKYSEKSDGQMIGQFGLGFYSAFMVAESVEIQSLSFKSKSKAAHWICTGSTDFEISEGSRSDRGTEMILHVADDSLEFLEEARIEETLNKYCKYLPIEIVFGTKKTTRTEGEGEDAKEIEEEVENVINNTSPIWTKKPTELSDGDYKDFYKELFPLHEDPLFWIHLNVDHPFHLTGVLYFPKTKNQQFEPNKSKIKLYSNQVFITDAVQDIVPEFLQLLHGVIDSPDIPLNVSRSYLQTDSNVRKISNYITKKVADKLADLYKKDRKEFENKWDDIDMFVKYGMMTQDKFYEKAEKFFLFTNTESEYSTIEEYRTKVEGIQTDKEGNLILLYSSDPEAQNAYLAAAKNRSYDVLKLGSILDSHFISLMESKMEKTRFKRIDSESIDKLIPKEEANESLLNEEQLEKIKALFEGVKEKENLTVAAEALSTEDAPVVLTQSEYMRRMKEQAIAGGMSFGMDGMPDHYELVINTAHPYNKKILAARSHDKKNMLAKQALDLALLSQGLLKGERLSSFIGRSVELLQ